LTIFNCEYSLGQSPLIFRLTPVRGSPGPCIHLSQSFSEVKSWSYSCISTQWHHHQCNCTANWTRTQSWDVCKCEFQMKSNHNCSSQTMDSMLLLTFLLSWTGSMNY